jgi:hypothetical protein
METVAYYNWGRWVADCPRPGCVNALQLHPGQDLFVCQGMDSCGAVGQIEWPPDPSAIAAALNVRPIPRTRNWKPGETLADLMAENLEYGVI